MTTRILRIVPKGMPAAGWDDEDECNMEQPCDLVHLVEEISDDIRAERELERKSFATGHEASSFMGALLRGGGGGQ